MNITFFLPAKSCTGMTSKVISALTRVLPRFILTAAIGVSCGISLMAAEGGHPLEAKLSNWVVLAQTWAAAPEIRDAVRTQNLELPAELGKISRETWTSLSGNDPVLRMLRVNEAAKFMRRSKSLCISEAFVNDAAGNKVAMLEKTTNWNHRGSAKHDKPMAGLIYYGPIVYDESCSTRVVQIAVPILEDGVPIGSLVLGINVYEIAKQ